MPDQPRPESLEDRHGSHPICPGSNKERAAPKAPPFLCFLWLRQFGANKQLDQLPPVPVAASDR